MLHPASLLLCASALLLCGRTSSAQERLERYVALHGSGALAAARAIDALYPGEGLRKVGEARFRREWSARFGPEQELGRLAQEFLRLQALEYGLASRPRDRATLERWRAVPRAGARAFSPPAPGIAALLQENEPNDEPSTANPLTCADQVRGTLSGLQDRDVFVLVTTTPLRLVARVDPDPASPSPLADPTLELLDARGTTLAFNDDANGSYPELDLLLPSGEWFFRVAAVSPTMNGGYLFSPSCAALPSATAGAPLALGLAAGEESAFLVDVAQPDALRLAASPAGAAELELELIARDGLHELARSRVGATPGEAAIRTALPAGIYFARVRELSGAPAALQVLLTTSGTGIPVLGCGASSSSVAVGGESNPAFLWQPSGVVAGELALKETGWPHATRAHIDDALGAELRATELTPEASGELRAVVGPGAYVGLAARNAGAPAVLWRDSAVARSWSRPRPAVGPYAGPTDLQVSTLGGFAFVDEHLDAAGLLRLRFFTEIEVESAGWDFALFVDRCAIEVDGPAGRQGFAPIAARWIHSNHAGWAGSALLGGAAELAADDELYLAANLADSTLEARETCALELDFDLSSLGARGSELRTLRFLAEWYFGGNATIAGATAPPSFDDSSEEANVFARRVELLRHGPGTWDLLGDVIPFDDRVEVRASCASIPLRTGSAEDEHLATLDPSAPWAGVLFEARTPIAFGAVVEPRSPTSWRGSAAAAAWRAPNAQYPGPIRRGLAGPLPSGVIGPASELRLRLRWEACWDDTVWDCHHYYDVARLGFDAGAGLLSTTARACRTGPDAARFTGGGTVFTGTASSDLAADDGVYARTRREDHDTATFGASAEHWDELDFDLSAWLAPGAGGALLALEVEIELYRNGAGASPTPSTAGGSEELLLRSDLRLEVYDFAAQTWIELAGAPAVAGYPFAPVCAPVGVVDPELLAFEAATGRPLGRDDDGGGGFAARLDLAVGDAATGASSTLLVAGISPNAGTNDRGALALRLEAPFGHAGSSPFELVLGNPFAVSLRGPDGWLAFGWHSYLPALPIGLALGAPIEGLLLLDATGLFLVLPNAQPIVGGRARGSLPTPAEPSLVGGVIHGQGILFDPASGALRLVNEDRVIFRP